MTNVATELHGFSIKPLFVFSVCLFKKASQMQTIDVLKYVVGHPKTQDNPGINQKENKQTFHACRVYVGCWPMSGLGYFKT